MRRTKQIIIAVIGTSILLLGIAMILLPGPAFLVIPAGLAILATEFEWARRWLAKCRSLVKRRRKPEPEAPVQADLVK